MPPAEISQLAHADHPIAAPLADDSVAALLRRARLPVGARLLDVGCGQAEWLIRALRQYPTATADGVDISAPALARAGSNAQRAGVADRLRLHEQPAQAIPAGGDYDLVLCVGSTHALGGFAAALPTLHHWVRPGGLLLIGDGFWARPPTEAALSALQATPDDFADLAGTVSLLDTAGWVPVYGHVSEEPEWDDYEWSWTGSLARWALEHPGDELSAEAARLARSHRQQWLTGYRGVLGFVTLLLVDVS